MTADALAHSIPNSSPDIVLITQDELVLVFQEDGLQFDGLVQERHNFSALVMKLHISCPNPSNCLCHATVEQCQKTQNPFQCFFYKSIQHGKALISFTSSIQTTLTYWWLSARLWLMYFSYYRYMAEVYIGICRGRPCQSQPDHCECVNGTEVKPECYQL